MAVRSLALRIYFEKRSGEAEAVLLESLLDSAASIRHMARFYLRQRGYNLEFAEHYRANLRLTRVRELRAAILGLSETGKTDDAELVVPFAVHDSAKVARAALQAMDRLDSDGMHDDLVQALGDSRRGVCGTARRLLSGRIRASDERMLRRLLVESPAPHNREAIVHCIGQVDIWGSLPLLLSALEVGDQEMNGNVVELLKKWLHDYSFSLYAPSRPPRSVARTCLERLDVLGTKLPQEIASSLRTILSNE